MAKATSSNVATSLLLCKMSFVYAGTCNVIAEPKNQNQEIPKIDRNTLFFRRAKPTIRQVSVQTFQLIFRSGSLARVLGIFRLAR